MEWVASLTWAEQGALWVGFAVAYGLAAFLLTSKTQTPPPAPPMSALDMDRLDAALQEFSGHLDALRAFANTPVEISSRELEKGGHLDEDEDFADLIGRGSALRSGPPPSSEDK